MIYVGSFRRIDPPMDPPFHTTGYVELVDRPRPARATGAWPDVWDRVDRERLRDPLCTTLANL